MSVPKLDDDVACRVPRSVGGCLVVVSPPAGGLLLWLRGVVFGVTKQPIGGHDHE